MIVGIDEFRGVPDRMFWRGSALNQIAEFERVVATLAERLHVSAAEVVGSHRSKSIDLPVVMITTDAGKFTLRDNFNDINLMAILRAPARLSLEQFFADIQEPLTWEWYLAEIDRARNYSWREWTDEEMNDPRILRVHDKRPGVNLWWDKKPDEKDRWACRMSSPTWHSHDWSSGEFSWDGDFGPDVRLFHQGYAHAEGIEVTTKNRKYQKGLSDFIIAVDSLQSASLMIERLNNEH